MYRRDLLKSEIEKLAQVLARIIGLKTELKLKEAEDLFHETLQNGFSLNSAMLYAPDEEDFNKWLIESDLGAEKLNTLGDFLFSELDFDNQPIRSLSIARKLDLVYKRLSDHYHTVHLINLGRQKYIQQYFS